jgi:hypothetical protein
MAVRTRRGRCRTICWLPPAITGLPPACACCLLRRPLAVTALVPVGGLRPGAVRVVDDRRTAAGRCSACACCEVGGGDAAGADQLGWGAHQRCEDAADPRPEGRERSGGVLL